eukprot:XP_001705411.1 Hypothetical protein GL50803_39268 [Giardia lamblia ATCC 50803]
MERKAFAGLSVPQETHRPGRLQEAQNLIVVVVVAVDEGHGYRVAVAVACKGRDPVSSQCTDCLDDLLAGQPVLVEEVSGVQDSMRAQLAGQTEALLKKQVVFVGIAGACRRGSEPEVCIRE